MTDADATDTPDREASTAPTDSPPGADHDEDGDESPGEVPVSLEHADDANAGPPTTDPETDEGAGDGATTDARGSDDRSEVRRYVAWGGLAVCSLLAVFALGQFYASVTAAIDLWVDSRYQPFMRAAFNFAVLLVAVGGVSVTVRELS